MSCVFILAPVLTVVPVVLAATTSAAAAMGFSVVQKRLEDLGSLFGSKTCEEVVQFDIAEARGLQQLLNEQGAIVLERTDATVCFQVDNGRVQLKVRGKAQQSRDELEALGRTLLDTVTQQYAYHLVVSDLKKRGFDKVLETAEADGSIRLQLRRWD